MYSAVVDRQHLHRLGKQLIAMSRQVSLEPGDLSTNPAERLVLGDVALHPGSTISEIVERTGFTQGYVSKCVAGLAEQNLVTTGPDAADRRRTLVEPTSQLEQAIKKRTLPMEDVIRQMIPADEDPAEVIALLEKLSQRLLP